MDTKLRYYLRDALLSEGIPNPNLIDEIQARLDFELPKDYVDFMREANGVEGEVGENGWLDLFPIEQLEIHNDDYYKLLMDEIPEYYLIGKDAADTGFAFHKTKHTFH